MPGIGGVTISPLINLGARRSINYAKIKSDLISSLQAASLWNDNDRIYLLADKDSPLSDLTGSGVSALEVNSPVSEPSRGYHTGVDGAGYLDFNFTPSVDGVNYQLTDAAIIAYFVDDFRENQSGLGFVYNNESVLITPCNNSTESAVVAVNGPYKLINIANNTSKGVKIINRKGTTLNYWDGGIKKYTTTQTADSLPSGSLYGLAYNNGISANQPIFNRLALVIFRAGLTDEQALIISEIIENTMNSYGAIDSVDVYNNSIISYKISGNPIIHSQLGSQKFASTYDSIYYSDNNGDTWMSRTFSGAKNIEFAQIFSNGNVIFADKTKIYNWPIKTSDPTEIVPKDASGNDYIVHTPVNVIFPGNYYSRINVGPIVNDGVNEMIITGNYSNFNNGACPINIYEIIDDGTVNVIYQFGQNPYYTDNGTNTGGTGGNLLGDSSNTLIARHVHTVAYDDISNKWYVTTGDQDRGIDGTEVHVMEGIKDTETGIWTWSEGIASTENTRFKMCGLNIINGVAFWGSDSTGNSDELGIYKSNIEDLYDTNKHTKLYDSDSTIVDVSIIGTKLIATPEADNYIIVSQDLINFEKLLLDKIPGPCSFILIQSQDVNGFFELKMAYNIMTTYKVIFNTHIKIK